MKGVHLYQTTGDLLFGFCACSGSALLLGGSSHFFLDNFNSLPSDVVFGDFFFKMAQVEM